MKKTISGLLALALTVTVCAGCGGKTEPPSGIYYDITGIDPNENIVKIGEVEFPAEMYFYWTAYNCSSLEYNLSMYYAYGMYADLFDEEGKLLWDADFADGQTLSEYAAAQAEDAMRFYAAIETKAKENGVTLTEDDQAAIAEELSAAVEELGGEEAFEENLKLMGLSRESFQRISEDARLFDRMAAMVMEEGSVLYVPPDEFETYAAYADHILIPTINLDTQEALSEEAIAEKSALAQDLLAQLEAAGDTVALFNQLADEYSEDPGRTANQGYVVTADSNFVEEFKNAALGLEPGQISGIVESNYGYHILLRRELPAILEKDPEQKSALAEEYLYGELQKIIDASTVERSEKLDAFHAGEFYVSYQAVIESMTAEDEPENDTGTDGEADDGTGTGTDGTTDDSTGTDGADPASSADNQ